MKQVDIIIIGAGITGLTAAHRLNKRQKDFLVLEKNSQIGGVIQTEKENGFVYETGPNTAILGNIEVIRLFDDLVDFCEMEIAKKEVHKRYILKNGNWKALPQGVKSAISTPLFTLKDKFRILGEPFRTKGTNPHETLSQLVKRRMGNSFLDYAIDPFILGVYAGDPNLLITKYALPKLYNLEQDYGSFIGGSIKKRKEPKSDDDKKVNRGVFSVKGGLSKLTQAVYQSVGADKFMLSCQNIQVFPQNEGFIVSGKNANGEGFSIQTKQIISTTGSHQLPNLMPFINKSDMEKLTSLLYAKVVEVVLGFNEWKGMTLDGFGGLIPHKENRKILGIMFMSALVNDRAPEGGALFSIFMGGVRRPNLIELDDNEITKIIESEVRDLLDLENFKPDLLKIIKHRTAIPQYGIESGERFQTIDNLQKQYKGLWIGGNLRDGIGMADRILQAAEIANKV